MTRTQRRTGPLGFMVSGVKEMPRNASWLLGKAVSRDGEGTGDRVSTLVDSVRQAGTELASAMPGRDSVDARLERARTAAERAQQAEQEAVDAATRAQRLAEEASDVQEHERSQLDEAERAQANEIDRRTAEACRRAGRSRAGPGRGGRSRGAGEGQRGRRRAHGGGAGDR